MPRPDPERAPVLYAPPILTQGQGPAALSPPPPPPPLTDRAAAWRGRRPLIVRVLAVLCAQFCAATAVGLALTLAPGAQAYVRARSWPVASAATAAALAWVALAVAQAKAGASASYSCARLPLLALFSVCLALFLGTLAARLPGPAALTATVGVGVLVLAAILAAGAGVDLTCAGAGATALLWAAALTAGATIWVARAHGDRWWVTLLAGLAVCGVAIYLALDVQALAGLGPLAGGGRWGWRAGSPARPARLAADDWVGGAAALATDLGLGFVAVGALASGGRL
jgi:hypothetical protein